MAATASITIQGLISAGIGNTNLGPGGTGFVLSSTVPTSQSAYLTTVPTTFGVPTGSQGVIIETPATTAYTLKGTNNAAAQILLAPLSGSNTYMILFGPSSGIVSLSMTSVTADTGATVLQTF